MERAGSCSPFSSILTFCIACILRPHRLLPRLPLSPWQIPACHSAPWCRCGRRTAPSLFLLPARSNNQGSAVMGFRVAIFPSCTQPSWHQAPLASASVHAAMHVTSLQFSHKAGPCCSSITRIIPSPLALEARVEGYPSDGVPIAQPCKQRNPSRNRHGGSSRLSKQCVRFDVQDVRKNAV